MNNEAMNKLHSKIFFLLLSLYISGWRARKCCHMNVFTGGISMSGTLGGDETIVALQLSAAAMQREPGKCDVFSIASRGD